MIYARTSDGACFCARLREGRLVVEPVRERLGFMEHPLPVQLAASEEVPPTSPVSGSRRAARPRPRAALASALAT